MGDLGHSRSSIERSPAFRTLPHASAFVTSLALLAGGSAGRLAGQNVATSLLVLSRDARRAIPLTAINNQEFVALDDLAATFQLAVREEAGRDDGVVPGRARSC